jgi:hypothetical protein
MRKGTQPKAAEKSRVENAAFSLTPRRRLGVRLVSTVLNGLRGLVDDI